MFFIRLPYTPDLTQTGIAYATRWLAHHPDRLGKAPIQGLHAIVVETAVELAFRRYLAEEKVPYGNLGAAPFSDPERYTILLGGRRVAFQTTLVHQRDAIHRLRQEPASLLEAPALVSSSQLGSEQLADKDLCLFAFVPALISAGQAGLQRAQSAGQPIFCLRPLPAFWAQPDAWLPLGELALKSDCSAQIDVELGGRGEAGEFLVQTLSLAPRRRAIVPESFYSLAYLHPSQPPDGRLGVSSPRLPRAYIVEPFEWSNLWVYGLEIILAGYLTCGELRRQAARLPAGRRLFLYESTPHAHLSVPVADLHPIGALLQSAREWSAARRRAGK